MKNFHRNLAIVKLDTQLLHVSWKRHLGSSVTRLQRKASEIVSDKKEANNNKPAKSPVFLLVSQTSQPIKELPTPARAVIDT